MWIRKRSVGERIIRKQRQKRIAVIITRKKLVRVYFVEYIMYLSWNRPLKTEEISIFLRANWT